MGTHVYVRIWNRTRSTSGDTYYIPTLSNNNHGLGGLAATSNFGPNSTAKVNSKAINRADIDTSPGSETEMDSKGACTREAQAGAVQQALTSLSPVITQRKICTPHILWASTPESPNFTP